MTNDEEEDKEDIPEELDDILVDREAEDVGETAALKRWPRPLDRQNKTENR